MLLKINLLLISVCIAMLKELIVQLSDILEIFFTVNPITRKLSLIFNVVSLQL